MDEMDAGGQPESAHERLLGYRLGADPRAPAVTAVTYLRMLRYALAKSSPPHARLHVPSVLVSIIVAAYSPRYSVWCVQVPDIQWVLVELSVQGHSQPNP